MWNRGGSGLNSLRVRIQSLRLSEPWDFDNSLEPMCCNESAEQIHRSVPKVQMNNSYEQAGLN